MSSELFEVQIETEIVYEKEVEVSSEDPPMDEWSSFIIDTPCKNTKKILYEHGLYKPGSGEICTKYISQSDSTVLRHLYYNYPAVLDPGIIKSLLEPEEKVVYPDDGQNLYMALCKEMNECPVQIFHKNLLNDTIDLRYYCVNPYGIRAMTMALRYNRIVTTLILTDNFLNDDACFHLNEMLTSNSTLKELVLTGCRIGSSGTKYLFSGLHLNRSLRTLNLNRNQIGDAGFEHIAKANFRGLDLEKLYLSYNQISGKSANIFGQTLETYNKLTNIDLSWNNLFAPVVGTFNLLTLLAESKVLEKLDLSWNSLSGTRIGTALKEILKTPNLKVLDLSNNKLSGDAIEIFIENLGKAKKLMTLNLSYNPMTPEDALKVLSKMKSTTVKVKNLLMENVFVNGEFLVQLQIVKNMKTRKNTIITYGGVIGGFLPTGPDMRDLVLNRMEFLTRGKKRKVDVSLVVMEMLKNNVETMPAKSFAEAIAATGASLDVNLIDEIINAFPGPRTAKTNTISIKLLVDFINRKWPDKKLPPSPPPVPETKPDPQAVPKEEEKEEKSVF